MVEACPTCGLRPERIEGQWLGAIALNLGLTQAVLLAYFALVAAITWPDVPWGWLTVTAIALAVGFPLFFQPFSRAYWLAVDIWMRPVPADENELIAVAGWRERHRGGETA